MWKKVHIQVAHMEGKFVNKNMKRSVNADVINQNESVSQASVNFT